MPNDPTVQVAALGIISAVISSVTIIVVARINKKEPEPVVVSGNAETEKILRAQVAFFQSQNTSLERTVDRKEAVIERLHREKDELEEELAVERAKNAGHGTSTH